MLIEQITEFQLKEPGPFGRRITVALLLRVLLLLLFLFQFLLFSIISVIEENTLQMGSVFVKQIALKVNFTKICNFNVV